MSLVTVPHTVGDNFVEAKSQLRGAAGDGQNKLRVQEWLAAGEAEDLDAAGVGVFQEPQGDTDIQAIGPFDGDTAMGTSEVALVGAGERQVVGPKRMPSLAAWGTTQGPIEIAAGWIMSL